MYVFSQWHHDYRMVWADGRKLPNMDEVEPKWNGYSVGHWEGDTFVVNSVGFNDRTWLDTAGHPHSDALHVTERYTLSDANHIAYEVTVDDPKMYTKPWSNRLR